MKTFKITVTKYFNRYEVEDIVVDADSQKEAEEKVGAQVKYDHGPDFDIYDIECLAGETEELELMVAIKEQNKDLERSGGDYWNYDPVDDEFEERDK